MAMLFGQLADTRLYSLQARCGLRQLWF